MARFEIISKHYLNVGDEWEQVEMQLGKGGKQARHRFKVCTFLDPEDASCHNYPGQIIVATEASAAHPRDLIFSGKPNREMIPLDPEAEAMLAALPQPINPMSEAAFPTVSLPQAQPAANAELESLRALIGEMQAGFVELKKQNLDLQNQLDAVQSSPPPAKAPSLSLGA